MGFTKLDKLTDIWRIAISGIVQDVWCKMGFPDLCYRSHYSHIVKVNLDDRVGSFLIAEITCCVVDICSHNEGTWKVPC